MLVEIAASSFPPPRGAAVSSAAGRSNRSLLSPARPARPRPSGAVKSVTWRMRSDARIRPVAPEATRTPATVKRPGGRGLARVRIEHKRLHRGPPLLVGTAHEGADLASGEPLDGGDELRPHRPLQGVALEPHEIGLAGGDQVLLGARRGILEHADDEILLHDGPGPRRSPAREVGDQLAQLVRYRRVQRPSGQAPLRFVHAATSPSRLWAGPRGAGERRAPGEASENQHTSRPAARPDPKTPPICPLRAGYTHCCDFRCRSPTATWVARVARSEFAGRQLSTTGPGPSGTFFLTILAGTFHG